VRDTLETQHLQVGDGQLDPVLTEASGGKETAPRPERLAVDDLGSGETLTGKPLPRRPAIGAIVAGATMMTLASTTINERRARPERRGRRP